jgi:hypothetical protein
MPDLETRLPELLHDLSTDMPADAGRPVRVLRRARRRRAVTAATTAVTVVALVAGAVVGVRELAPANRSALGNPSESPTIPDVPPARTAIGAVWPETTDEALSFAQQQVDDGHQPWRTDPAMTAEAFAVNMFGWPPEDVRSRALPTRGFPHTSIVEVHRAGGPATDVMLAQLGTTGVRGVWSVTRADTSVLTTDVEDAADGARGVRVQLLDGNGDVAIEILDGSASDSGVSRGNNPGDSMFFGLPSESPTGGVVVVVSLLGSGQTLAADAFRVRTATRPGTGPSATPTPQPTGVPPSEGLPAPVAATRDEIARAVGALDFDAMRDLMDANTFSYNFDDGSNPIPAWKDDPSVLDPITDILALPPAEPRVIGGYGTFHIWPYLVDSNFERLSAREIEDLHRLGFDDAAIEDMRRFGSYLGPRLSIDETGLWRNYTTGGD